MKKIQKELTGATQIYEMKSYLLNRSLDVRRRNKLKNVLKKEGVALSIADPSPLKLHQQANYLHTFEVLSGLPYGMLNFLLSKGWTYHSLVKRRVFSCKRLTNSGYSQEPSSWSLVLWFFYKNFIIEIYWQIYALFSDCAVNLFGTFNQVFLFSMYISYRLIILKCTYSCIQTSEHQKA